MSNFKIIKNVTLLSSIFFTSITLAKGPHTSAALENATTAAGASDSTSVDKHANEALKHTRAAKIANKSYPEVVNHIQQGEIHLKAAINQATNKDVVGAVTHAHKAKIHLESAEK